MTAIQFQTRDDTYQIADDLSDAESQSPPPQNPHSQYQSCRLDETAALAALPGPQMLSPYRTALSRHNGCRPAQCSGEKWSSGFPAAVPASYVRRTSSSAHTDHNPSAPNQSTGPRSPLHSAASPPPPPCSPG